MRVAVYEEEWDRPANMDDHQRLHCYFSLFTSQLTDCYRHNNIGKSISHFICISDHSSGGEFELKPFSQRKRTQPSQLTGSWKVFAVSATPIFGADANLEESNGSDIPYVYLCTVTIKKRSLPDNPVHFGEEEMLDMQDATILWLPGGICRW